MSASYLSLSEFRTAYPEAPDDDSLVQSKLDQAAGLIDPVVAGDDLSTGHGFLTAHLLAMSPYGRDARIAQDQTKSTYGVLYEDWRAIRGGAYRLILD